MTILVLVQPLDVARARKLLTTILANGGIAVSGHAKREMSKDGLTMVDVTNVLRGGVVEPAECENGSWRHRVRTGRITVVIALRSETEAVVVTAWRTTP